MLVVEGREVTRVEVASTGRARRTGLLGRRGCDHVLWLPGTRSVHTRGMKFTIEVAWIDRSGRVKRVAKLPPGRISGWVPGAVGVLEAEAGNFAEWGVKKRAQVHFAALHHPRRNRAKPQPVNPHMSRFEARKFRRRPGRRFPRRKTGRIF